MGVIRVLDEKTANQIAAGEVVDRPASVVKELIENALDAGAAHIEIVIDDGGSARMLVVDDGGGMARDDAVLCFSRHATSKITTSDDLERVATYGFRGEALAAIASVARVRLATRQRDVDVAATVVVEAGRVASIGEAGGPVGTRVDVVDLFFQTPARRKFLKSARAEAAHVECVVQDAALGSPHVAFRLVVDGRTALDVSGAPRDAPLDHPRRVERAVQCLGEHVRPSLHPFTARSDLVVLTGYLVAPKETRRDGAGMHLTVNRRPVQDRGLTTSVRTAFRASLEAGRHPILALDLAIDPGLVDVNVHPRKAEVRFTDARRVHGHTVALLSEFLSSAPWTKAVAPARTFLLSGATAHQDGIVDAHRARVRAALDRYTARAPARGAASTFGPPHDVEEGRRATSDDDARGRFSSLRTVGQARGLLVLDGDEGLVVVDRRAAHERVLRARMLASPAGVPLLFPAQATLSADQIAVLVAHPGALARFGVDVEPFGPRTALVKALPAGLDARRADDALRDALAALVDVDADERDLAIAGRLARHAAPRPDPLTADEVRALLVALDGVDDDVGEPFARALRFDELAAWFARP